MSGRKCFMENLQLFADAKTNPEKFNLYNGLLGISDQIDDLERRIKNIENLLLTMSPR